MASNRALDPSQQCGVSESNQRKRRRVPEEERRRVSVACAQCRRLKEKCDGERPCGRCQRTDRICEEKPVDRKPAETPLDDSERTAHLERIAKHFLGDISLDLASTRRIVQNLEVQDVDTTANDGTDADTLKLDEERFTVRPLTQHTAHYSGEYSHWNFSRRLLEQLDRASGARSTDRSRVFSYWRAHQLGSQEQTVRDVLKSLPPRPVAIFLAEVYFGYAQTNTFFIERSWLLSKLETAYSPHLKPNIDDAAWTCTVVAALAVACQFVHMAAGASDETEAFRTDNENTDVGKTLYHLAAKLLPDVITLASVESVQACLMLAHYALPLNADGLGYTYFSLALKMAIQNGMHRKWTGISVDPAEANYRDRLFWTAHTLEKRICSLHGRPTSMSQADVEVEQPTVSGGSGVMPGEVCSNRLAMYLNDFTSLINLLRKCPKRLRQAYFERLIDLCAQYDTWWSTNGPDSRELPAALLSRRQNIHLRLWYQLNLVFVGRLFIFCRPTVGGPAALSKKLSTSFLVEKGVESAMQIVQLCQELDLNCGLAGASYIEFSSCRAAVLMLLARLFNEHSDKIREVLSVGMQQIHTMALNNVSAKSEANVISAIETAVRQHDAKRRREVQLEVATPLDNVQDGYESFKMWASMLAGSTSADPVDPLQDLPFPDASQDVFDFGWSPFDSSIAEGQSYTLDPSELANFEASLLYSGNHLET